MRPSPRVVLTVAAVVLIVGMTLSTEPPWLYHVVADLLAPAVSGRTVERALNVVLFVPIGVAIALWGRPWWLLGAVAGSVTVELLQFLLPRSPELSDVVTNSLGALLGYLVVVVIRRRKQGDDDHGRGDGDRDIDRGSGDGDHGSGDGDHGSGAGDHGATDREVDWSTQ